MGWCMEQSYAIKRAGRNGSGFCMQALIMQPNEPHVLGALPQQMAVPMSGTAMDVHSGRWRHMAPQKATSSYCRWQATRRADSQCSGESGAC